jgi:hypothetical protein
MRHSWTKNAFWNLNTKKWLNGVFCIQFYYLITSLSQGIKLTCAHNGHQLFKSRFYFWLVHLQAICAKYGLETWFPPNDDIRIFCSTCSVVEVKTLFETWRARNDVIGVYWFHLSYLITVLAFLLCLNVLTMDTNFRYLVLYVWLFDIQNICSKYGLETSIFPNDDIRIC